MNNQRKNFFSVEEEAKALFGEMRPATAEEESIVHKSIEKIASPTGINFWDAFPADTEQLAENLQRIHDMSKFEYDWNGYGAKPFQPALIDKCKNLLKAMDIQPEVFPTARESIQFEYELKDGSYLEFEIFEDRTEVFMVPKRVYKSGIEKTLKENEIGYINHIANQFHQSAEQAADTLKTIELNIT